MKEPATQGLPMSGASAMTGFRYMEEARHATLEYYVPGRTRTKAADRILGMFATAASSVTLARGANRDEIFEQYDLKLWSYNDHLALFTLATLPSVVALTVLNVAFRGIQSVHSALSH